MENEFKLKFLQCEEKDLKSIGLDRTYTKKAIEKHLFKTIKIYNVTCAQANILKQTALSCGTDCAVHREVITGKIDKSDCILSGSVDEILKIAEKLKYQPLKLSNLSIQLKEILKTGPQSLPIRDIVLNWQEPYLMGILNITPDSFSDGGKFNNIDKAIEHYKELVKNGADIIDIGGESTRPFSNPISEEEEQSRVIPIIEAIRKIDKQTILSIDTRNAQTAKVALQKGIDIVNDISSMEWDNGMSNVIIDSGCPIIITHASATPDIMQTKTDYSDVVEEIFDYFYKKIKFLTDKGIAKQKIIIDPGIGFGKTSEQNFEIIKRIHELKTLGCAILVGHSRKSFIKETLCSDNTDILDTATAILTEKLIAQKVNIIRVHNIESSNIAKKLCKSLF